MKDLRLFNESTLNIFCDASITSNSVERIGCPGSIAVDNRKGIIDTSVRVIHHSTNNDAEITAILLAAYQALAFTNSYSTINIFSDSKISVFGLNQWVFNWIKSISNGVLYSTSGTPVANQHTFEAIICLIVNNNLHLNLYHQKGHVTESNLKKARDVFYKSNGITLADNELRYISKYNNAIDNTTRQYLYNSNPIQAIAYDNLLPKPISYTITQEIVDKYSKLL